LKKSKVSGWDGKVALITGGSSGIGLAAGRLLAAQGAHVLLVARRVEPLRAALDHLETARRAPSQCFSSYSADVSAADEAEAAVEYSTTQAGLPDLIINSAGVVHPGYFQQLSLDQFRWMMEINYFGTVNTVKAALPGMIQRRSGTIVNISSAASFMGFIGYSAYAASKYAVNGFSEALRSEVRLFGIQVSLAFPPDTDTPQLAYENQYKPEETKALTGTVRPLSADTVARKMLEQVAAGKFLIFPSLDVKLMFHITRYLGGLLYPAADWITDRARRHGSGIAQRISQEDKELNS
jgi:3-dehydrosphinganine reductase